MIPFQKTDALYEEAELRYIFRIFGYYIFKFARIYELKPPKKHPYNCSMLIPYARCARFLFELKILTTAACLLHTFSTCLIPAFFRTYNCSMSASGIFCIFSRIKTGDYLHVVHFFFAPPSLLLRSLFAPRQGQRLRISWQRCKANPRVCRM